jgi:hypothetical protein
MSLMKSTICLTAHNATRVAAVHVLVLLCTAPLFAQAPSAQKIFDGNLSNTEKEVVSLAEAMPAEQYNFAPTQGAFKGVRTFALEVRHIATVLNQLASGVTGQPMPAEVGKDENGPDTLKTKEQIVKYLKDSFAFAHKAAATLTNDNMLQETADGFAPNRKRTRVDSISIMMWHTYDHYGQMVEYARMNGVIPPASR